MKKKTVNRALDEERHLQENRPVVKHIHHPVEYRDVPCKHNHWLPWVLWIITLQIVGIQYHHRYIPPVPIEVAHHKVRHYSEEVLNKDGSLEEKQITLEKKLPIQETPPSDKMPLYERDGVNADMPPSLADQDAKQDQEKADADRQGKAAAGVPTP